MPGKKDARAPGKPNYIFLFSYLFSKHIACQLNTIKRSSVNSIHYRIDDGIGIIHNPRKIEKFRNKCWNFSNFVPSQQYLLNDKK